jgi:hypothetical protein
MTALVHLFQKVDDKWESAGGKAFENDDIEGAQFKAERYGQIWAGDNPNRRYEVVVQRWAVSRKLPDAVRLTIETSGANRGRRVVGNTSHQQALTRRKHSPVTEGARCDRSSRKHPERKRRWVV